MYQILFFKTEYYMICRQHFIDTEHLYQRIMRKVKVSSANKMLLKGVNKGVHLTPVLECIINPSAAVTVIFWDTNVMWILALCAGNSPVTGEFPSQRPVTRSFGVFFDLRLS